MKTDLAQLPDWPALMDADTAALYCCGISVATFKAFANLHGVKPIDMGLRLLRYRRRDLDALIDRLPARGEPSTRVELPIADASATALAAVRARHRGPSRAQ